MPLLPLEPFVFPENLLDEPAPAAAEPARWWVLHTKPRVEKALTRRLLKREVPFFLPLCRKQWRNRGRQFCSYVPLFPSYVFLKGDTQEIFKTFETKQVARVLTVDDQAQLQADLARVYWLIMTGAPLDSEERLEPGTPVAIISGPLAGLEGKVLRRGKQLKFIVEVQFLQRGVSVEIESWMIEPRRETRLAAVNA